MKKSPKEPDQPTTPTDLSTHATPDGTQRYTAQFRSRFAHDFYRESALGLSVSSIGLGTYLGDPTDVDDAAYVAAVGQAIASGINLIDTAINYRNQRSERVLCVALQAAIQSGRVHRDELVVCTKGGYIPLNRVAPENRADYQAYVRREFVETEILGPDDIIGGGHSLAPRFIRYCVAKSRQNLGLRTIDLYYVHNPEQQLVSVSEDELYERLAATFAVLEEATERGEIKHYGIATWDGLRTAPGTAGHLSLERVVEAAKRVGGRGHRLRAVQLPVNLAMSEAVRVPTQVVAGRHLTVLQAAAELGLSVIGSATLMQARLTTGLPPTVREHFQMLDTDAQRAIEFARTIEGMTSSLVGMKRTEHVTENLGAAAVRSN
ncbi:MAG TPA: aldo/keto reductase [Gemmatimonadaceae bacterium]